MYDIAINLKPDDYLAYYARGSYVIIFRIDPSNT